MSSLSRPGEPGARPAVPELARLLAEGKIALVDVREVAEAMSSGLADGAKLLPLSVLPLKADPAQADCALPQGLPLVVYCAAGGRAARAADLLGKLGYTDVLSLGGLGDWAAGGGRVVPFKG